MVESVEILNNMGFVKVRIQDYDGKYPHYEVYTFDGKSIKTYHEVVLGYNHSLYYG